MGISETDFIFISDLLRREAAIVLDKGKEYLVETRLLPIVRSESLESLDALVKTLRLTKEHPLKKRVIEALTTNETSFFRDIEPFEVMKHHLIPDLMKKRAATKELAIWSAACSTGQEPYSLAMLLRDSFPQLKDWKVTIYATDLATNILEKARAGKFTQYEVNRGLPAMYLVKYMVKHGSEWCIKDEIKQMIQFSELNLIAASYKIPPVDLVLLRNVLIYFDIKTKAEIFAKIKGILRPDGHLFLGSAETTLNIDAQFQRVKFEKGSCFQLMGA